MKHSSHLLSIVTPSFNQADFLEKTILSVLDQDYPAIEYLIIDGGSTDGSVEIIKKYEKNLAFWVSEPDHGQSDAINKGWKRSTGDIIAWLNADDTYCPGTLAVAADIFSQGPDIVLVHGAANTFDRSGKNILHTSLPFDMNPYDMLAGCGGVTTQPSIFFRRTVLNEVGYLNLDLHYIMDWEYCIRIGLHFGHQKFHKTGKILSNNRDWAGTKTNQGWKEICVENRRVLADLFRKYPDNVDLQKIKPAAFRSSYRKQAELARMNGHPLLALDYVAQAMRIEPMGHNPARELAILLYVLLGRKNCSRLRTSLAPLRNRLNKIIGY